MNLHDTITAEYGTRGNWEICEEFGKNLERVCEESGKNLW
jgi:hypothetical protein